MKKFKRVEIKKNDSDVQNITEIYELAHLSGEKISREQARKIYREQLSSEYYQNDKYLVAVRATEDFTHLSIRRLDRGHAKDWREFQQIKNELLGEDIEAVELYPKQSRVVDAANQYHLWALPKGEMFPIGYAKGFQSDKSVSTDSHTVVQRKRD